MKRRGYLTCRLVQLHTRVVLRFSRLLRTRSNLRWGVSKKYADALMTRPGLSLRLSCTAVDLVELALALTQYVSVISACATLWPNLPLERLLLRNSCVRYRGRSRQPQAAVSAKRLDELTAAAMEEESRKDRLMKEVEALIAGEVMSTLLAACY